MLFAVALMVQTNSYAQINVNISAQPLWGPTGYDHVDNYYLPDIESYYSVPKKQYIYQDNGNWVYANALPSRYANYNIYNGYKVVVNGDKPFSNFNNDKVNYSKYKNWGGKQTVIKNSNDKKYFVVKGHPHGMPPGQAKKVYGTKGKGNSNIKSTVGSENGKVKSKGKGGKGKH